MKILTTSSQNKANVANVRSQIKVAEDLKNFDNFLSKYPVIDFQDAEMARAAQQSCWGDYSCNGNTVSASL